MTSTIQDLTDFWGTPAATAEEAWERLHPDLQPYVGKGPLGTMLRHPLIYELTIMTPDMINRRYAAKRTALETALAEGDVHRALWLHERPYRLTQFVQYLDEGLIPDVEEQRGLLRLLWTDTEFPSQHGTRFLVRLFRRVGFVGVGKPTREITISRGVRSPKFARGVSWTLDRDKAVWFARRGNTGGAGYVYTATVAPEHVLAVVLDRDENEVVVVPRGLRRVKVEVV